MCKYITETDRGGLGVSNVACHAAAPGSNPGASAFI